MLDTGMMLVFNSRNKIIYFRFECISFFFNLKSDNMTHLYTQKLQLKTVASEKHKHLLFSTAHILLGLLVCSIPILLFSQVKAL